MILSNEEIEKGLNCPDHWLDVCEEILAKSHFEANARISELEEILHAFLRAPSTGSDDPGSHTIVVQDFNIKAAKAAIAKATGKEGK